ncbi:sugar transferase [Mucilaginibacter sp. L3T2-6]|uniref:sugar transferase n=1 Tax=Mucilaginibacter sp. L3T2-6 TaxID=3062491 RepID=UPI002675CD3D|nr:sugar transferase [Mucilaginibacter sp. L3T2-6]MDO3644419.1 sugar transferase [Mucilaginibacter sp. L3T2-6]MDV6216871.1 sugar transferase [Mucilaginibacter sp. L3T2-6]
MVAKRIFDICFALTGVFLLSPLFILIALLIMADTGMPVFYFQKRIGLNGKVFNLIKFRTMLVGADRLGYLTIGNADKRITKTGYFLRKHKLDELPQLFNVLIGDMSFVGPRPEVSKYVKLYTPKQLRVLSVRPGITDWASIQFFNENELLARSEDPEKLYIKRIMPSKIERNLNYIDQRDMLTDVKILFCTLKKLVNKK